MKESKNLSEEVSHLQEANKLKQEEVAELQSEIKELCKERDALKEVAGNTQELQQELKETAEALENTETVLNDTNIKYKKEQDLRKKFMNDLEDIKGNIRVYCRVRPLNRREKENAEMSQKCVDITSLTNIEVGVNTVRKEYSYNAVFDENSTQEEVFEDTKRLI